MKILQIAPTIGPGTGVGAVAHHLEQEWRAAGVDVDRFTLDDAGGGWLPEPGPGLRGRLVLLGRVVWFSTVGSVLARRRLAGEPGTVGVCHNDALAGDVYVNHGILRVAMAARGGYAWRMLRNPLHLFTSVRDTWRYRSGTHRVVVNLTPAERDALVSTYSRVRARTQVIGNGVDVERFRPPTAAERRRARAGLPDGATNVVFVGHEFARKGLPLVLEAVVDLPGVHVTVVGGTSTMLDALRRDVSRLGIADRVHLAGQVVDSRPFLHGADLLALPSAYEANALVVLEALACGVPVVATPVGYAPQVVRDGVDGYLVDRTVEDVRRGVAAIGAATPGERAALGRAARREAEAHTWGRVAGQYLDLFRSLARGTDRTAAR
ncbi:UDP-glucose:(heptosyl)LPS alpha-1,3-glucosyltransferase [Isoptericola sp. CG 20/1183]|uniref:UDP-glucose:(Heptosyl)LPS alpha-1,3-glucosyltransferase n=1 Tax=Isoptericola halotolerans TaxID=300560 RepID=A0ABX5EDI6_9MICO|nr:MULTISPECIES: glycosyltransferase family 4 protein [Isoptericola]PRZ06402.1 UDP-glucose:(heptosyl)LPS alpha-1,3-glucosyltransferase [Isoptericola halotolerans]PRZ06792.1 UDP-glucose:(heptosyl)LPS alpha-1,3-glucosyltransferase [Isoptericola sp. CG 20/1183]